MITSFKIFENLTDDKISLINELTEKEALKIFRKNWDEFTPQEINKGFCEIWSKYFYENIGGQIMKTFVTTDGLYSHTFIKKENKYFDAEVPYGVEDILELPYIKRWIKKCNSTPNCNLSPTEELRTELLNSIEERTIEYINDIIDRKKKKR